MKREKRPALSTVGIRQETRDRLRQYVDELESPRVLLADVVSIAVDEWLNRRAK
jgi:hypothetical protein